MADDNGWFGMDLDGTLARYESGDFRTKGWKHIGEPIPEIVEIAKTLIAGGRNVKVMTARVSENNQASVAEMTEAIQDWTEKHIGVRLPVTNVKDFQMIALFDDRAIQVIPNEGIIMENLAKSVMAENMELKKKFEELHKAYEEMLKVVEGQL